MKRMIYLLVLFTACSPSMDSLEYAIRGSAKADEKNYRGALEDFDISIAGSSNDSGAFEGRALCKEKLGDIAGAIKDFDQSVIIYHSQNPTKMYLYLDRGSFRERIKDYNGAMDDYNTALKYMANENGAPLYRRGLLKALQSDFKGAIEDYNEVFKYNIYKYKLEEVYYSRGKAYLEIQNYNSAIADFNKALELDPYYINTLTYRGLTKAKMNDFKGAIQDYDRAIYLDDENSFAYKCRGDAYNSLGKSENANANWKKAKDLDKAAKQK